MTTTTLTLTEFLLARIAEDEEMARAAMEPPPGIEPVYRLDGSRQTTTGTGAEPVAHGRWGWNGGPIDHDHPETKMLSEIFGDEPKTGVEVRPFQVIDSGGWDESEPIGGAYVLAEVPGRCPDEVVRHIARHDPARVLAECEAKRRIVERAEAVERTSDEAGHTGMFERVWTWREVLRTLATVHADHEDFREEWR